MRSRILYYLLFTFFSISAQAQYTLSGVVVDQSSDTPLEFATVSIKSASDDALISGSITEMDGGFEIDVPEPGDYYAEVEYIGFERFIVEDIVVDGSNKAINLGQIGMSAGGVNLDAVEITAEKSELQFSLDKRVFNVGKDLSSRGGNAQDLLDNIPSISVGVEGEVELRGSGNVRILVNGRPSGLVGINGTDGLRSIPSHLIERVEVITNPSAKYEAEGMAGIINIILKKDDQGGFNGTFEVSGGHPESYGAGVNLNYRKNRLNWFINYNYNHRTSPGTGSMYQEFYNDDITNVSVQQRERNRSGNNNAVRFGADYFFTENQSLTGAFLYRYGQDDNYSWVSYRDTAVVGRPVTQWTADRFDSYILREDFETETEPTQEYSLRYDNKLGKDHTFTFDMSFQDNSETEDSDIVESLYKNAILTQENLLSQRAKNSEAQNQWRFQADYVRPLAHNMKTELGGLASLRNIDNDYRVETLTEGVWVNEEGLTNNFLYDEKIYAAYANLGQEINNFSYLMGLRYEYSDINTELVNTNENNPREYSNLFPSVFLNYKLPGENSLQMSFSRRIQRPRFWDLNPFFTFSDRRNFFSGNPNLDPEFTNSFELGHLKYWETANIGTTVYYRHTTDLIQRIQTENPADQTTIRRPENIGSEDNYGVEFVFAYTGLDWLRLDGSVNGFKFVTDGVSDAGQELTADAWTITGSFNSRWDLPDESQFQFRVNYRAPRETVQGRREGILYANAGYSKDFLNDNLTVTLSVRDIFNQRRWQTEYETDFIYQESDFQWRPRSFEATVTYRLNMKKQRERSQGRDFDGGDGGEF